MQERVRIVNGQVVRERVPAAGGGRATSTSSPSPSPQNISAGGSGGRLATLFDPAPGSGGGAGGGGAAGGGGGAAYGRPAPAQQNAAAAGGGGGVVDQLARSLGAEGRFVETPAIPFMGWRPVQLPLVYVYIVGILLGVSMLGGLRLEKRILIGAALALAFFIHAHQVAALPGTGGTGGGTGGGGGGGGGGAGGGNRRA